MGRLFLFLSFSYELGRYLLLTMNKSHILCDYK